MIYITDFRWSHETIMLLFEEYRQRESSTSSGKIIVRKHRMKLRQLRDIMSLVDNA